MILKCKTTLMSDGSFINWKRVTHVKVTNLDIGHLFTIQWKYKASIKSENFAWEVEGINLHTYFNKFGLVKLENYFINLDHIMLIQEEARHGPIEKTKVHMIMSDGFSIDVLLTSADWAWWKSTFL